MKPKRAPERQKRPQFTVTASEWEKWSATASLILSHCQEKDCAHCDIEKEEDDDKEGNNDRSGSKANADFNFNSATIDSFVVIVLSCVGALISQTWAINLAN